MGYGEGYATAITNGQGLGGERAYADADAQSVGRAARQVVSIPGLIAQAAQTQKFAADRAMSLDALAGRALDLATRLSGSFPAPAPERGAKGTADPSAEPRAALDGLQQAISGIGRPLSAMDDSFARLVAGLDAIERALS